MSRQLHFGETYQIKYGYSGLYGGDGQDAFYDIMRMFDIENSAEDRYTDDYEVERTELQKLRQIITEQGEEFKNNETEYNKCLKMIEKTHDEFVGILDGLIKDSDQQNEYVLFSWF